MTTPPRLLIVAAEPSADLYGKRVLEKLRLKNKAVRAFGIGGEGLRKEGLRCLVPAEELSLFGLAEVWEKIPRALSFFRRIRREAQIERPHAALLIDAPDFNVPLASALKRLRIPVVYYMAPQVWAWRRRRIHVLRRSVDSLFVGFPFEKSFFRRQGISAEYFGHPIVENTTAEIVAHETASRPGFPTIAVLPGSRPSELEHHVGLLNETAERLRRRWPNAHFIAAAANRGAANTLKHHAQFCDSVVEARALCALAASDAALVCSGSATLEAALAGTPMAIFYKLHPATYHLLRALSRYRGPIGIPNLIQERRGIPEFIQNDATPQNLAEAVDSLLSNADTRQNQIQFLQQCRHILGSHSPSEHVANQLQTYFPQ